MSDDVNEGEDRPARHEETWGLARVPYRGGKECTKGDEKGLRMRHESVKRKRGEEASGMACGSSERRTRGRGGGGK